MAFGGDYYEWKESEDPFEEDEEENEDFAHEIFAADNTPQKSANLSMSSKERGEESSEEITEKDIHVSPTPPISRIGLNDHKAGMDGLDKAKINQIILEASKGSRYYNNEVKREKQVTQRIDQMLSKLKTITEPQKALALKQASTELESIELTRDLSCVIVHVDMDAFYAAVEMRDNPLLKTLPMAVGGNSMLSTSNYLARKFGVRAAMPGFIAKKLCSELVIVPPNFAKYQKVSEEVRSVLVEYDPQFSPVGLDESYLDITDCVLQRYSSVTTSERESYSPPSPSEEREAWKKNGYPEKYWQLAQEVVEEMREKIQGLTSLTASAGIAPNKMLAKVVSDINKPNGQYFLPPRKDKVLEFIRKLPIRKIPGIGKVTERMLNALGIMSCQDLFEQRGLVYLLFSPSSYQHFSRVCIGVASAIVNQDHQRKSISTERTFSELSKAEDLLQKCKELCDSLAESLNSENLRGRTVTIKLKTVDFQVLSRALSLSRLVASPEELYKAASELLKAEMKSINPQPLRLRLMGVRLSNLEFEERASNALEKFFKKPVDSKPLMVSGSDPQIDSADSTSTNVIGQDCLTSVTTSGPTCSQVGVSSSFSVLSAVVCPVCLARIKGDNLAINQHIDICLNQCCVEEVTSQQGPSEQSTSNTRVKKKLSNTSKDLPSSKRKCLRRPANQLEHFFLK